MKKIYILAFLIAVNAVNLSFAKTLRSNFNKPSGIVMSDKNKSTVLAVDFSASDTLTCTGAVKFTDLSANGASAWIWYFGDGGAATVQNPSHTYTAAGYYTVKLITVGIAGIDSAWKTDYIHVDFLPAPTVSPDTTICKFNPAVLTASGTGTIAWFDSISGGSMLDTGNVFTSLPLLTATTFYAQNQQSQPSFHGGALDSTIGTGNNYNAPQNRYMTFNCNSACQLVSFLVYAQGAGTRTIYLADSAGNQLKTKAVTLPDGASRAYVNFDLQAGISYRIGVVVQGGPGGGTVANLYRNNAGAVYPYDINGLISITGNNGNIAYYYFFYDWEVSFASCVSPRVPVTVSVTPGPQASFIANQNLNIITCTDLSLGATSWSWNFGDGDTSTLQNPVHTYLAAGTYTVTLTASNGTCSSNQVVTIVVTTAAGINELNTMQVSLQPNPVKDMLTISFPKNAGQVHIDVINNLGQTVYTMNAAENNNGKSTINFTSFTPGVYTLKIASDNQVAFKKIIKE